jgi:hypothetical protein
MEEDQLRAALLEWEGEGGSVGSRTPESPSEPERSVDARHRRGSLGPPATAVPLGEAATGAQLHAHLAQLLDVSRESTSPDRAPVTRDAETAEQRLTPHEDIERQPDGVPHLVIGLTALFSVLLAAVLISMFRSGPTVGSVASVALALIAIPVLVSKLGAKAERDRDHDHPSR